jgi:hypothetical protein
MHQDSTKKVLHKVKQGGQEYDKPAAGEQGEPRQGGRALAKEVRAVLVTGVRPYSRAR